MDQLAVAPAVAGGQHNPQHDPAVRMNANANALCLMTEAASASENAPLSQM